MATRDMQRSMNTARTIVRFFWRTIRPYKRSFFVSIFLVFSSSLAVALEPYVYKRFIDSLSIVDELRGSSVLGWNVLFRGLLLIFIVRVTDSVLNELGSFMSSKWQVPAMRDLLADAFRHVLSLSYRFHSSKKSGSVSNVIRRGMHAYDRISDSVIFSIIPLLFNAPFLIIMVALVQGWIAVIVAVFFLAFIAWSVYANERIQKYDARAYEFDDRASGYMLDSLLNFEAVKSYTRSTFVQRRFRHILKGFVFFRLKAWKVTSFMYLGNHLILAIGVFALLAFSVQKYLDGSFSVGDVVLLGTLVASIAPQLYYFAHSYNTIRRSATELMSLIELHHEAPEIRDANNAIELRGFSNSVEFRHVVFGYQRGRQVVRGVSFNVPKGTRVAFVGPSGAGKTTLIKLLLRFFDVTQGAILIDGVDLRNVRVQSLRKLMSVVPQDPLMFHDTVKNNILFGRPNASHRDVEEAAKRATAHDFITNLSDGYETIVGERGVKLSGGERQRVAIARAFLADTPIILLDEATSSLDSASELQIQYALQELMEGRTTFTVAHRLSTIRASDMIVVMDDGRVSDIGTHDELLKRNRIYRELWTVQVEGFVGG